MAIKNFIPTVWSENLYTELDRQYIGVKHCNREFEGDIRGRGSSVKICGVGAINVSNYTKDTDLATPQTLDDSVRELIIDQAKCFNFQIDDIDRAQTTPKLMNAAMKVAASALANEADKYIYSLYEEAGNVIQDTAVSADTLLAHFIEARKLLYVNNVTDSSDIVFEVSPEIAALIIKAKLATASDNVDVLENGCLGSIAGCKIFVSNNIATADGENSTMYKCLARTGRAIAFAEQLSEINAYRPEKRFADAVKGLHLYGAKVVYPTEMVLLDLGVQK